MGVKGLITYRLRYSPFPNNTLLVESKTKLEKSIGTEHTTKTGGSESTLTVKYIDCKVKRSCKLPSQTS